MFIVAILGWTGKKKPPPHSQEILIIRLMQCIQYHACFLG